MLPRTSEKRVALSHLQDSQGNKYITTKLRAVIAYIRINFGVEYIGMPRKFVRMPEDRAM